MVNLLKNNSTQGLYFLIGKSAAAYHTWVTNNTPGEADLSTYTLYSTYIYFDSVIQFQSQWSATYEGDTQVGFRTWADLPEGNTGYYTGGHDKEFISITVETTRTIGEGMDNFKKYWNKTARGAPATSELYLVRQTASETFYQFANETPALKKYVPIVIVGVNWVDAGTTDRRELSILCQVVW